MFKDRETCREAAKAIADAVGKDEEIEENKNRAGEEILTFTGHENAYFFSGCGSAIYASLYGAKTLFLPDQGVWKGVLKIAELLNITAIEIPTTLGLISIEDAESILRIKKSENSAFFLSSFAGYIAEQDIKAISEICRKENVVLIEDASGAIGDQTLANGKYSDIIVCSTGAPKIINLYSGGFLSTSNSEIKKSAEAFEKIFKIYPFLYPGITEELKHAKKRVEKLVEYSSILKKNIENAVFKDKRGVCVGLLLDNAKEFAKKAAEQNLKTEKNKTLLTLCPRYDRFLNKGAVIELKKLDVLELSQKDINKIISIVNSCI